MGEGGGREEGVEERRREAGRRGGGGGGEEGRGVISQLMGTAPFTALWMLAHNISHNDRSRHTHVYPHVSTTR